MNNDPFEITPELIKYLIQQNQSEQSSCLIEAGEVKFELIRSDDNQWHIVDSVKGSGAFGVVYAAKFAIKIGVSKTTAEFHSVNHVIKAENLPQNSSERKQAIADRKNEFKLLRKYGDVTYALTETADKTYMFLEDCGENLTQFFLSNELSFEDRYHIALGICNEWLELKRNQIVHRDLKPENICIKRTKQGFRILIVDFGAAQVANQKSSSDDIIGTLFYMAPELAKGKSASYASDAYPFAALLAMVLFGAGNEIFKYKRAAGRDDEKVVRAPYDFSSLVKDRDGIPQDIDNTLLTDCVELLNQLQNKDPKQRTTMEFAFKFLSTIPERRKLYAEYLKASGEKNQVQLQNDVTEIRKLSEGKFGLNSQSVKRTSHPYAFRSALQTRLEESVYSKVELFTHPKSHLSIVKALEEKRINSYTDAHPFPETQIVNEVKKTKEYLTSLKTEIDRFSQFFKEKEGSKFDGTNSSGIEKIQTIFYSQSPASKLERFEKICKMSRDKTKPGLANLYSHSHFFRSISCGLVGGRGRHENVEKLFTLLAALDTTKFDNDTADVELRKINRYIEETLSFVHQESPAAAKSLALSK